MAVHQNLSEIGWFYHAPEPPRRNEAQGVPLASQIPGLNDLSSIHMMTDRDPYSEKQTQNMSEWQRWEEEKIC